jgi:lysozyme
MVWSQRQCDAAFLVDMKKFEGDVRRSVKVQLTQWQFDALTSFTYNCGSGALASSTLLKKVNAKDFDGAALEFHKWNRGGGKVLPGLVRRRASESLLFQNIADNNYDGRADVIQPLGDAMPQDVDAPKA